jgi:hypothetical protein
VTTSQKWLGLFILEAALLGGAFGGGYYTDWKQRQVVEATLQKNEETYKAKLQKSEETYRRQILVTRGRAQLMEAALAIRYGNNFAMAFERVVRVQGIAQNLKLPLEKDFEEAIQLLITQAPESLNKILLIADKIEPPPPLVPPEQLVSGKPAPMPASAPKPSAPSPTAAGTAGPAAPAPAVAAVKPAPTPVAQPAPSPPAANPQVARPGAPDASTEPGRTSLLEAKELLISGGDTAQAIQKIAHAVVLLEEANRTDFADSLGSAIKALRTHDEPKARAAIDAALAKLRSP